MHTTFTVISTQLSKHNPRHHPPYACLLTRIHNVIYFVFINKRYFLDNSAQRNTQTCLVCTDNMRNYREREGYLAQSHTSEVHETDLPRCAVMTATQPTWRYRRINILTLHKQNILFNPPLHKTNTIHITQTEVNIKIFNFNYISFLP